MVAIVKNVLFTSLMVVATTVVSSVIGGVLMLVVGSLDEMPTDAGVATAGIVIIGLLGAVFGMFFSAFAHFLAAMTMPPVLLVTDWLKLPRPAMDVIGGGSVGLLCALSAIELLSNDKFAGMVAGENAQVMASTGLVMGCLFGYLRHMLLVRPRIAPTVPQFAT
jgi:hypothetical protein